MKEVEDLQVESNKMQVDESAMPKSPLNLNKPSSSVSVVDELVVRAYHARIQPRRQSQAVHFSLRTLLRSKQFAKSGHVADEPE